MGKAGTQPLKVDEAGLAIAHHDVLRLEIAVDKHARKRGEAGCDFLSGPVAEQIDDGTIDLEETFQAVLKKVVLLPEVKLGVKFLLKSEHSAQWRRWACGCKRNAWSSALW